jgi:hypothetical protein
MASVSGPLVQLGIRVEGLEQLQAQFAKVEKMPKKYLTKAGREGIADDYREIKAGAPVGKTGMLKKAIKKKLETPNKRKKGVYRLSFDPKFTDHFQKPTTGIYGGDTPYAYYPASVEYGYLGPEGKVYVKTLYWADNILKGNEEASLNKVIKSLNDSIDELLK